MPTIDDTFLFDYPEVSDYGWHPSTGVPKHRLVMTGIVDAPWGFNLSAKWTLASPRYSQRYNCVDAVDLALSKEFEMNDFTVRLRDLQPTRTFKLSVSAGWR